MTFRSETSWELLPVYVHCSDKLGHVREISSEHLKLEYTEIWYIV